MTYLFQPFTHLYASGGGFSNYFAIPDYQKKAVGAYLENNPIAYDKRLYNSSCSRGFPDLSANGANYVISVSIITTVPRTNSLPAFYSFLQVDGAFRLVYGTSASSPVVGAILTLVNDARLAIDKSPIGFINPTVSVYIIHRFSSLLLIVV